MLHMSPGYADHEFSPRTFFSVAGATTLFATGAMSYYSDEADGYRVPGFMAEPGNITLLTDLRSQVAIASLVIAGPLAMRGMMMASSVLSGLGAAAVMSLVASEGQKWAEDGKYFGINLPALPALPGQSAQAAELSVVENIAEVA